MKQIVQAAEAAIILAALNRLSWNRIKAAAALKISYRSLLYKIKEYSLQNKSQPAG